MHHWTNWDALFSTRSVRQLRVATLGELLGRFFSVRFMPRCYKQDMCRVELLVRQLPAAKNVSREVDDTIRIRRQATIGEATAD
jgi:hypothetical protein